MHYVHSSSEWWMGWPGELIFSSSWGTYIINPGRLPSYLVEYVSARNKKNNKQTKMYKTKQKSNEIIKHRNRN